MYVYYNSAAPRSQRRGLSPLPPYLYYTPLDTGDKQENKGVANVKKAHFTALNFMFK